MSPSLRSEWARPRTAAGETTSTAARANASSATEVADAVDEYRPRGSLLGVLNGLARSAMLRRPTRVAVGVLSRLFEMPSRASSSSNAGLPSRSLFESLSIRFPPRFPNLPFSGVVIRDEDSTGFDGRLRQVSKHSEQQGRPSRSTIG